MTATGRSRKPRRSAMVAIVAGLALTLMASAWVHAAITERVVTDARTGLALYGFDPVSYFTDGAPSVGEPSIEYRYAGVVWRFRNEGNRAAFAANPDIYAPRFGGYDPLGIGRGVAAPGYPQLFVRRDNRIYLFHKEETRNDFVADPAAAIAAADAHWPQVMNGLVQ